MVQAIMLGLALGQDAASSSGGGLPAPTATFTVAGSQPQLLPDSTVQRSTTTGGAFGKGTSYVPIVLTAATTGTYHARLSSGGGTRGDILAEFAAGTILSGGAQTLLVPLDVTRRWVQIDLVDSTGVWQNGSVLVGAGLNVLGPYGQSLAEAFRANNDTTLAAAGVTVDPYTRIFATNTTYSSTTISGVSWELPADAGHHPGAGSAKFLAILSQEMGMNVGMGGHAVAGTPQSLFQWTPTGTGNAGYQQLARIAAIMLGGWEIEWWFGGHNESEAGVLDHYYQSDIDFRVFGSGGAGGTAAINPINLDGLTARTGAVTHLVSGIPMLKRNVDFYYGRTSQSLQVRKGGKDWCAAAPTKRKYVDAPAMKTSDGTHEVNAGGIEVAICAARARLSDNVGPSLVSAARDVSNPNDLIVTLANPGTALQLTGNWWKRVAVYISGGTLNWVPCTSGTAIDATHFRVTLTAPSGGGNWGDGNAFDVYLGTPNEGDPGIDPSGDMIRDDRTDTLDPVNGRPFVNNVIPIVAAALNPVGATTPTANYPNAYVAPLSTIDMGLTSVTYDTVEHLTGFGFPMIGGYALTPKSFTGNLHELTYSEGRGMTMEGFFRTPAAAPSSNRTLFYFGGMSFTYDTLGRLRGNAQAPGAGIISAALPFNSVIWCAFVQDASGTWLYHFNHSGVSQQVIRAGLVAATSSQYAITALAGGINASGSNLFTGTTGASLFEFAVWDTVKYTGGTNAFAARTTPLVGNEANLIHLWRGSQQAEVGGKQPDIVKLL